MTPSVIKRIDIVDVTATNGVLVVEILLDSLEEGLDLRSLERRIVEALQHAQRALLIDCHNSTSMVSSQFLAMLVRLHALLAPAETPILVCGLNAALREVYRASGLAAIYAEFATRDDALQALIGDRFTTSFRSVAAETMPTVRFEMCQGVLIVTVECADLTSEPVVHGIEQQIVQKLSMAETGVLIDCRYLSGNVSSRFLSTIVRLTQMTHGNRLQMALCNLATTLRQSFETLNYDMLVRAFPSRTAALAEFALRPCPDRVSERPASTVPTMT